MPQGWSTQVYRTDTDETQYIGFFLDDDAAQAWIDRQEEGVYEITARRPVMKSVRPAEEAAHDADNAAPEPD